MSKKRIVTFIVGIMLVMVLLITLPYKIKIGSIKFSKIDYFAPDLDYTYKIDLPQLKGDEGAISLFNASIYELYNEFISFNSDYELKENAINDLFDVDVIEDSDILFLIVKMNNKDNKLFKILYFDKVSNVEITSEKYIENLLMDDRNVQLVNKIRNDKNEELLNINNIYLFKDKNEIYKKAITYLENDKMNYIIKEIE